MRPRASRRNAARLLAERRARDAARLAFVAKHGDPWMGGGPGAPANWNDDDRYEDPVAMEATR